MLTEAINKLLQKSIETTEKSEVEVFALKVEAVQKLTEAYRVTLHATSKSGSDGEGRTIPVNEELLNAIIQCLNYIEMSEKQEQLYISNVKAEAITLLAKANYLKA